MSEETKESYLKLPNVRAGKLQDVVDFMEDNDIEYTEFYEKDLKQQILYLQQKVEQLEKENKELKEENKHIFQNVNDDELLISNAMNYAEAQRLNNIINRIYNFVDRTIEVIKQQPTGDDEWILERLNGIKYLIELKDQK